MKIEAIKVTNTHLSILYQGEKYSWYLEEVDGKNSLDKREMVPRVFTLFGPPRTIENVRLLSVMLIDWIRESKMRRPDPQTKCPYHRPVSLNNRIRVFFAAMKKNLNWILTLKDVEGFDGSFGAWLEKEYIRRQEKYVN